MSDVYNSFAADQDAAVGQAVNAIGRDPEEAADARWLERETGFPAAAIADPEQIKNSYRQKLTADIIRNNFPLIRYINENPRAAEVSSDDWHNLVAIRQAVNGEYHRGAVRAFSAAAAKTLEDMGTDAVGGLGYLFGSKDLQDAAQRMRNRPGTYMSQAEEESFSGKLGAFAGSISVAVPALLTGSGALGLMTLAGFGLTGGEEQRIEAARHGGSEGLAYLFGAGTNIAMTAAMGWLLRHPIQVAAPGIASWLVAAAKNAGRMSAVGTGMMEGQKLLEAGVAYNTYNPDASYHFDALGVMANGVGNAILGGFGHKAKAFANSQRDVPPGIHEGIDRFKQVRAQVEADQLQNEFDKVRGSGTFERDPKLAENYLFQDDVMGGKEIGIPWDMVKLLYGEDGPRADDGILGWVPDIERQWQNGRLTGADIIIPRPMWLTRVDPEVYKALKKDIRTSEQGLTLNEVDKLAEWRKIVGSVEEEKPKEEPPAEPREVDPYEAATEALRDQVGLSESPPMAMAPSKAAGGAPFPLGESSLARTQQLLRLVSSVGSTTTGKALDSLNVEHWGSALKPYYKEIAKAIKEGGGDNVSVHVISDAAWDKHLQGPAKGFLGFYDPVHDTIWLRESVYNSDKAAYVFIHEAVHAATSRTLHSRPEIQQRIYQLIDFLRKQSPEISNRTDYGMTNAHEFLAESLSNEGFQGKLTTYEIPDTLARRLGTSAKNAWDWLVDTLAKMMGIKRSAYEAAIKLSKEALDFKPTEAYTREMERMAAEEEAKWAGEPPKEAEKKPEPPKEPEKKGPPEQEALKKVESPVEAAAIGETQKILEREMELWKKAKEEDLIAARKRAERDAKREVSKEWKQEEAKQRAQVMGEIEDWASVKIALIVHEGRWKGHEVGEVKFNPKFLTEEEKAGVLKKFQSDKGFNPEDLANIFGYPSGREMMASFIAFEQGRGRRAPRDHILSLAEDATKFRVREKLGDRQERILQEIENRIVSPTMMDLVHNQTKTLASVLGQTYALTKADVMKMSKFIFEQRKPGEVQVSRLFTEAGRLGRDVRRLWIEGISSNDARKIEEAFKLQQKYQQVYFMGKLAKDYEAQMRKMNRTINVLRRKEMPEIAQEARAPLQALLNSVGITTRNTPAQIMEGMGRSGFDKFSDFIAEYKSRGHSLALSAEMEALQLNMLRKKKASDPGVQMTVGETLDFHEGLTQILNAAREEQLVLSGAQKVDLQTELGKARTNLQKYPILPHDERVNFLQRTWNSIRSDLRSADALITRTEEVIKDMDLRQELGPLWRLLTWPMQNAKAKKYKLITQLSGYLDEIKGFDKKWRGQLETPVPQDFFIDPRSGKLFQLNKQDLIGIMLNFGSRSNIEAFTRGWFGKQGAKEFENKFIDLAREHLTKEDWKYIQHIWDAFGILRPHIGEMYHRLTGFGAKWVEAQPLQMPHGEVRGGYFPILRDKVRDPGLHVEPSSHGLYGPNTFDAVTAHHYLVSRTKYEGPILFRDTLGNTIHRLVQTIHDVSYREAVMNANKVLRDVELRTEIERRWGEPYLKMLDEWVRDTAQQHNEPPKEFAWAQDKLRAFRLNLTASVLGLSFKLLGSPATGTMVGLPAVLANPAEAIRIAHKYSQEIPHTFRNIDLDLNQKLTSIVKEKGLSDFQEQMYRLGFKPVAQFEQLFRIATFNSKFKEALGEGRSETEAGAIADSYVRERHGVQTIQDVSKLIRGNEFVRLFTLFFGFGNAMWSWHRQIAGAIGGPEEMRSWKRAATSLWGTFVMTSIFNAMFYTKEYRDDEWFKFMGRVLINNEMQMLPFIREAYSWFFEEQESRTAYGSLLKSITNGAYDAIRLSEGKEPKKPIRHIAEAVGGTFGLPLGQIGKTAQFLSDVSTGKQDPGDDIFAWMRGIISGESKLPKKPARSIL